MDWFLHYNDLRHERVKGSILRSTSFAEVSLLFFDVFDIFIGNFHMDIL